MNRRLTALVCCAILAFGMIVGCREEQALYRHDTSPEVVSRAAVRDSYAEAVPYVVRYRHSSERPTAEVQVNVAHARVDVDRDDHILGAAIPMSATAVEAAEISLSTASSGEEALPEALLLAATVSPTTVEVDPVAASVKPVESRRAATVLYTPLEDGPELEPTVGEVLRPGDLTERPLAEVMISYAEPAQLKSEQEVSSSLDLASLNWVENKWVDSPAVANRIGRMPY